MSTAYPLSCLFNCLSVCEPAKQKTVCFNSGGKIRVSDSTDEPLIKRGKEKDRRTDTEMLFFAQQLWNEVICNHISQLLRVECYGGVDATWFEIALGNNHTCEQTIMTWFGFKRPRSLFSLFSNAPVSIPEFFSGKSAPKGYQRFQDVSDRGFHDTFFKLAKRSEHRKKLRLDFEGKESEREREKD